MSRDGWIDSTGLDGWMDGWTYTPSFIGLQAVNESWIKSWREVGRT